MATIHLGHIFLLLLTAENSPAISSSKNHDEKAKEGDTAVNGPLLLNELLLDYDPFTRPASGDGPTAISVSIAPKMVSWKEDQLKTTFTLEQSWTDERLKFTGRHDLKLSDASPRIWLPDTVFETSLESAQRTHGLIAIEPNGQVRWTQRVILSFPCQLEPSQVWANDGIISCTLTLNGGWYKIHEVQYNWSSDLSPSELVTAERSSQLRKLEFMQEADTSPSNGTTSNQTVPLQPPMTQHLGLKIVFTIQTELTKSVLSYLTKKAMKDL